MLDDGHLGEGRLLLRAAAASIGCPLRGGVLPGLSRKVVALAQKPAHLLDNFPAYAAGAHGRLAHKRAGHHGPNAGELMEGGRRLTCLAFVAFACLFRDVMKRIVAPWGLAVQSASAEPWVVHRHFERHMAALQAATAAAEGFRKFLRVLTLLRQHVPARDLRAFVRAWIYAKASCMFGPEAGDAVWVRVFPAFAWALNGFLHADKVPEFRQVELFAPPLRDPDMWMCLGPHCQCAFLAPATQSPDPQTAPATVRGRRVTLPAWVVNGVPHAQGTAVGPRFHFRLRIRPRPGSIRPAGSEWSCGVRGRDASCRPVRRLASRRWMPPCLPSLFSSGHGPGDREIVRVARHECGDGYGPPGHDDLLRLATAGRGPPDAGRCRAIRKVV